MGLPPVAEVPLLTVDGHLLPSQILPGLSRSGWYALLARGDMPSVRVGRRVYVPNGPLRRVLGLDAD